MFWPIRRGFHGRSKDDITVDKSSPTINHETNDRKSCKVGQVTWQGSYVYTRIIWQTFFMYNVSDDGILNFSTKVFLNILVVPISIFFTFFFKKREGKVNTVFHFSTFSVKLLNNFSELNTFIYVHHSVAFFSLFGKLRKVKHTWYWWHKIKIFK